MRDTGTCSPGGWPGGDRCRGASGSSGAMRAPLRRPLPPNRPVASFGNLPACAPCVKYRGREAPEPRAAFHAVQTCDWIYAMSTSARIPWPAVFARIGSV